MEQEKSKKATLKIDLDTTDFIDSIKSAKEFLDKIIGDIEGKKPKPFLEIKFTNGWAIFLIIYMIYSIIWSLSQIL